MEGRLPWKDVDVNEDIECGDSVDESEDSEESPGFSLKFTDIMGPQPDMCPLKHLSDDALFGWESISCRELVRPAATPNASYRKLIEALTDAERRGFGFAEATDIHAPGTN
jgi:hypothetical protein